jgi:adenosylhomocysteine nucleosidase
MLIWMCALHCEAKPVIDFYRLRKIADISAFDLYQLDEVACVVSGIGDLNMAAACAWAASRFENNKPCWINLGIAGHKSLALGTTLVANQVYRQHHARAIYPVQIVKHELATACVISQTAEQTDYHPDAVYDMEAYAFLHSCSHFTPLELCTCIKVISDNTENPPLRDKARISQLIADNIQPIANYARSLLPVIDDFYQQSLAPEILQRFLKLGHFTRSQQVQLSKVLLGLRAFDNALDNTYQYAQQLGNSKTIIAGLQQQLNQQCEKL